MARINGLSSWIGRRGLIAAAAATLYVAPLGAQGVTLTTGTPEEVGMSAAVLEAGVGLYREAVARGGLVGAVLLVARNGKIVLHEAVGSRHWEANLPMEKNTLFRMASNTKPVVATGAAILVEGGKLSYADPVRKYMPSFDNYRSGFITLGHLLSHTSGFRINTLFIEPYLSAPTLQREAARFGEVGAAVTTGTTYSYSNPGFNTAGALIEMASGQLLDAFLDKSVYTPLGMNDTYHMEVADKLDGKLQRMGAVYYTRANGKWTAAWKPGDPPQVPFVRASGGLISTAPDYAVFLQMFLNGGIYGTTRILKPETVELLTSRHTPPGEAAYGYGWSLDEEEGIYSHGGSDGTFAWVDPARGIIGLVFTQTPAGENPRGKFMELVKLAINDPPRQR
ncbi:MAG: serine hydrolase domain-containing protein [Longimicrobiales bacterium]|nr:serine hydrolase domain-containing protein [Longimicrobiales bacterium]